MSALTGAVKSVQHRTHIAGSLDICPLASMPARTALLSVGREPSVVIISAARGVKSVARARSETLCSLGKWMNGSGFQKREAVPPLKSSWFPLAPTCQGGLGASVSFKREKRDLGKVSVRMSLAEHSAGTAETEDRLKTHGEEEDKCDGIVVAEDKSQEEVEEEEIDYSGIVEWEIDFCSRPILDERGKRVWELLVCDSSLRLRYSEFFSSNRINSATLKEALLRIVDEYGCPMPQKIRFFRSQMQTIISKACAELDVQPVPSQRCVTLMRWLESRLEDVYAREPGFQVNAPPLLQLEVPPPQDLPDKMRGEKWAFVQLPLSGIVDEMARVRGGEMFGSTLNLDAIGLATLPPDTMIPGVAVASSRATPLAAWTSALELAALRVDREKACLVLATGVSDSWRYAFYRRSQAADAEAAAWEDAKSSCQGLHFLAVQHDLEEEECTGFWLLQDTQGPQI